MAEIGSPVADLWLPTFGSLILAHPAHALARVSTPHRVHSTAGSVPSEDEPGSCRLAEIGSLVADSWLPTFGTLILAHPAHAPAPLIYSSSLAWKNRISAIWS